MAPTVTDRADVLVLEGNNVIDIAFLDAGMILLSQGRAKRMVVVLLYPLTAGPDLELERECARLIADESPILGLRQGTVSILSVPIAGHPITRSEAMLVTDLLHREGVRSAILFCDGFHTRRSIAAYRREASRLGLNIVPFASFTKYNGDSWWTQSAGIDDFVEQSSKFIYYLIRGYVPVTSLWSS